MSGSRQDILALLRGEKIARVPVFSGLINITAAGLEKEGLRLPEIHRDAGKLARAAASTYRLTGFESAVLPLDLCVEAEMFGAQVDFRQTEQKAELPRVAAPLLPAGEIKETNEGRLPIICEAIARLKKDVGQEIPIGAFIPGPFTLLVLLMESNALFHALKKSPAGISVLMEKLSGIIKKSAVAYQEAGADFITIHEMGGSPGVLGAARFEQSVLPYLQELTSSITVPAVLSVCGNTNAAMSILARAGANAISVDETNDLKTSRITLPDNLLFGNLDAVNTLVFDSPAEVHSAAQAAIHAGVDALWPGCDLVPQTPLENLRALVNSARQ